MAGAADTATGRKRKNQMPHDISNAQSDSTPPAHDDLSRNVAPGSRRLTRNCGGTRLPSNPTSDTSGKLLAESQGGVITLADLKRKLDRYLLLKDRDVLAVVLGAVAAHRLGGDPVWLLIVGPPSGAKTEVVQMLYQIPGIFPLSSLTAKTFASGLTDPHGPSRNRDPSLLARLKDQILVLKDFTTVLSMHREERQTILAQLREIYDGRFDMVWGTGKELHWEGRLGFIAGVTPVIEKHHSVMAVLGQRFILLRLRQADRLAVGHRAVENSQTDDSRIRKELALAVRDFMCTIGAGRPKSAPVLPKDISEQLVRIADFVTRARSSVERDGKSRELLYTPEPEMPARFARQLSSLACGVALVSLHPKVTDEDLARIARVGFDTIPAARWAVLQRLACCDGGTIDTLAELVPDSSPTTIRRTLEDLERLALVRSHGSEPGLSTVWSLRPEWRQILARFSVLRPNAVSPRCQATARKGAQCKRRARSRSAYCWQHRG